MADYLGKKDREPEHEIRDGMIKYMQENYAALKPCMNEYLAHLDCDMDRYINFICKHDSPVDLIALWLLAKQHHLHFGVILDEGQRWMTTDNLDFDSCSMYFVYLGEGIFSEIKADVPAAQMASGGKRTKKSPLKCVSKEELEIRVNKESEISHLVQLANDKRAKVSEKYRLLREGVVVEHNKTQRETNVIRLRESVKLKERLEREQWVSEILNELVQELSVECAQQEVESLVDSGNERGELHMQDLRAVDKRASDEVQKSDIGLQCSVCGFTADCVEVLDHHKIVHERDDSFICQFCNMEAFDSEEDCKFHEETCADLYLGGRPLNRDVLQVNMEEEPILEEMEVLGSLSAVGGGNDASVLREYVQTHALPVVGKRKSAIFQKKDIEQGIEIVLNKGRGKSTVTHVQVDSSVRRSARVRQQTVEKEFVTLLAEQLCVEAGKVLAEQEKAKERVCEEQHEGVHVSVAEEVVSTDNNIPVNVPATPKKVKHVPAKGNVNEGLKRKSPRLGVKQKSSKRVRFDVPCQSREKESDKSAPVKSVATELLDKLNSQFEDWNNGASSVLHKVTPVIKECARRSSRVEQRNLAAKTAENNAKLPDEEKSVNASGERRSSRVQTKVQQPGTSTEEEDSDSSSDVQESDSSSDTEEESDSEKQSEEKEFVCHVCLMKFEFPSLLKWHMACHSDDRNYKCKHRKCGKTYKTMAHLNGHMKSAHGTETLTCETCGWQTTNFNQMRSHQNQHAPADRYKCKVKNCAFVCRNRSSMAHHRKSVHNK